MGCNASTDVKQLPNNPQKKTNLNIKEDSIRNNAQNSAKNNKESDLYSPERQQEEAAIKIQSGFRGFKARKEIKINRDMKEDEGSVDSGEEVHKAATTIQAGFKGYKARKEYKKQKSESSSNENSPKKGQKKGSVSDEIADIDLNDPEVEKAATKIQATFRGYKNRREPAPK